MFAVGAPPIAPLDCIGETAQMLLHLGPVVRRPACRREWTEVDLDCSPCLRHLSHRQPRPSEQQEKRLAEGLVAWVGDDDPLPRTDANEAARDKRSKRVPNDASAHAEELAELGLRRKALAWLRLSEQNASLEIHGNAIAQSPAAEPREPDRRCADGRSRRSVAGLRGHGVYDTYDQ